MSGPVASFVTGAAGTEMTGGSLSACVVTDTRNVAVATLLLASVAVQVTVVEPTGNVLPDAGAQSVGTLPLTASQLPH